MLLAEVVEGALWRPGHEYQGEGQNMEEEEKMSIMKQEMLVQSWY